MAFNLSKLQRICSAAAAEPQPAAVALSLEAQLAESVAINRPASQRPAPADTLEVTSIEGPVAAFGQLEYPRETAPVEEPLAAASKEQPPAPKARRGRPRKTAPATPASAVVAEPATSAGEAQAAPSTDHHTDPKADPAGGAGASAAGAGTIAGVDVALARELLTRALRALGGAS